jgi:hypothetical protein
VSKGFATIEDSFEENLIDIKLLIILWIFTLKDN